MIGTEFLYGFGLGNQLFWYVSARALAKEKGFEFGICNPKADTGKTAWTNNNTNGG